MISIFFIVAIYEIFFLWTSTRVNLTFVFEKFIEGHVSANYRFASTSVWLQKTVYKCRFWKLYGRFWPSSGIFLLAPPVKFLFAPRALLEKFQSRSDIVPAEERTLWMARGLKSARCVCGGGYIQKTHYTRLLWTSDLIVFYNGWFKLKTSINIKMFKT